MMECRERVILYRMAKEGLFREVIFKVRKENSKSYKYQEKTSKNKKIARTKA